jgi:hypothetical protein
VFWLSAEGKTSALSLYKLQATGSSEIAGSVCFMHYANIGPASPCRMMITFKIYRGL